MNREFFLKIYWKLRKLITPSLRPDQSIYEDVLDTHCGSSQKWLDLGCGHQMFPPWRFDKECELIAGAGLVVGIDYNHLSLTKHQSIEHLLRGDITQMPFPDRTFDLITSNMVFEHLDKPIEQMQEIARVLEKGGKLIFHTPNSLGYTSVIAKLIPEFLKDKLVFILQGREEDDIFPAFYKINSPREIREIAAAAGFEVTEIKMTVSAPQFIVVPPIVLFELFWIRFLMTKLGKPLRTGIIATLTKT
jgi:ubiquinone/menaquinone biosynthesis C-methylase UbiE